MNSFSLIPKNGRELILDILSLLFGLSLFLFHKNMLYLHIIVIGLMISMLIKCYIQGIRSDRPYRNKLSLEQALEELEKGAGTQFDPEVVKALKKVKCLQMRGQDEK